MKDILVLRELEQIKAISHPYRVDVFECFEGDQPQSAKQIADKLGEPHAKVNYHIKSLLKVGILELVDEKVKSGIIEKYYLPAAKMLVIDKNFMQQMDDDVVQSLNQAILSIFEKISDDFYKAAENPMEYKKFIVHHNEIYMTPDEMKEIIGKVDDYVAELIKDKKGEKGDKNLQPYNFALLATPRVMKKRG
ncbi:ArsR/SmtB family transcription factor [Alkaliphilus peptidifermentans]|uniref:Helix-turn-helix domain-containing protein n=1 Tax=Alkaliphilus peptidifermentans DSM 18978 TaxID=1120976 RepID=A0A1G5K550_9FIRM|nr:helix-turn-helix domain-containing protein [Alkaliphilus peptidifermentans]SCY95019.1 Helix-turn-helix domain-containing protein [Alkaliphilus peptidifermentans DSM 18978]